MGLASVFNENQDFLDKKYFQLRSYHIEHVPLNRGNLAPYKSIT